MDSQWKDLIKFFREYWQKYGGLNSLLNSPYLQVAILITLFTYGFWYKHSWWEQSFSILPSILGFTLGGFAIFLGFGSDEFKKIMSKKEHGTSPYLDMVTSYTHFVLIQLLAIIFAIIAQGANQVNPFNIDDALNSVLKLVSGFIGYGLLVYSLLLSLAVCLAIFDLASVFAEYITVKANLEEDEYDDK